MTQTVTIGCKLPAGLILEMGKQGDENYQRHVIAGSNSAHPMSPFATSGRIIAVSGGYGLTPNVPKDLWDAWKKKHARMDALVNNLIFEEGDNADAAARGDMQSTLKSGFEPLNPDANIDGVVADQDHLKRLRAGL